MEIGTRNGKIAVEKNGELYHHPIIIGKERYKKQLVKQNSIVANKIKIRLSEEGINKSIGNNLGCDIAVVTSSFISRRYYELEQQHFDYIVVDDAVILGLN